MYKALELVQNGHELNSVEREEYYTIDQQWSQTTNSAK